MTVTAAALSTITVAPLAPTITIGGKQTFVATGNYSDGTSANISSTVVWASSDITLATVVSPGVATGVKAGAPTITATLGGKSGSATLTVTAATLSTITVAPLAPTITIGGKQTFVATGNYSDGTSANISSTVVWASSDITLATVVSPGVATGVKAGAPTITATLGGKSGSATLTVTAATLSTITVAPLAPTITIGGTQTFVATGNYSDGTSANISSTVVWASSDITLATVVSPGVATGVKVGAPTITATLGGKSGSATLTVTAATLSTIAVTPATPIVVAGGSQIFVATGHYSDGTSADISSTVLWASSDITLATVVSPGVATGLKAGAPTITASLGGKSGSATLTVTAATLSTITVAPLVPSIAVGGSQTFVATGHYSDGTSANISSTVVWSSSNIGVATVVSPGVATGVSSVGSPSTITAALSGKSGSATLTVTAAATVLPGVAGTVGANASNPTVISSSPSNGDTNVPVRTNSTGNIVTAKLITATFDEAMDPTTITAAGTFTLWDNKLGIAVPGTVTMNVASVMNAANTIATFTPTAASLNLNTNYTATITTAAKNAGSITAMPKTVAWSFTTMAASFANQASPFIGQAPVDLLSAGNFVILAQTTITDISASPITGNVGLSPATGAQVGLSCAEMLTGKVYEVDAAFADATCAMSGAANKTLVDNAVADMLTAYNEAAGRVIPDATELFVGDLSGKTVYPGLYKWSTDVAVNAGNVTLDAQGDSNAVWIFQISGNLNIAASGALPGIQVILANGAKAANIFWQVGGGTGATLGTYSTFNGNVLSTKQVIANTGAVVNGRLFAATQVTLQKSTVTQPTP